MSSVMQYVMGGLQTAGGAAATAMGQPQVGVPMMMNGAGQLVSRGVGNSPAPAAPAFVQPGTQGQASLAQIGTAMQQNPALAPMLNNIPGGPLNLNKLVTGIDPPVPPPPAPNTNANVAPNPGNQNDPMSGLGSSGASDFGQMYMGYLLQKQLIQQQQKTAYASPHSSIPVGQVGGLQLPPGGAQIIPPQY